MKKLWAPWRMEYIRSIKKKGCFLCRAWRKRQDEEYYVLWRNSRVMVVMNVYPYNNGHLLVAPGSHRGSFERLPPALLCEIMAATQLSLRVLRKACSPHGFNIGFNLGEVAGAGLAEHLHLHIVPRWNGDTSYLPLLGEVKVISQHLRETYNELIGYFRKWG